MNIPPPVPANHICTMPSSEWPCWWKKYPDGIGPVSYNGITKYTDIYKIDPNGIDPVSYKKNGETYASGPDFTFEPSHCIYSNGPFDFSVPKPRVLPLDAE